MNVVGPFLNDRLRFRRRLFAALTAFQQCRECDRARIAAVGCCIGGCGVLDWSRCTAFSVLRYQQNKRSAPRFSFSTVMLTPSRPLTNGPLFVRRCARQRRTGKLISMAMRGTVSREKVSSIKIPLRQGFIRNPNRDRGVRRLDSFVRSSKFQSQTNVILLE